MSFKFSFTVFSAELACHHFVVHMVRMETVYRNVRMRGANVSNFKSSSAPIFPSFLKTTSKTTSLRRLEFVNAKLTVPTSKYYFLTL